MTRHFLRNRKPSTTLLVFLVYPRTGTHLYLYPYLSAEVHVERVVHRGAVGEAPQLLG